MSTFRTQFGQGEAKDLFYPNVLTPDLKLSAIAVQDSFRRVFDAIYSINPPSGSREASSVLDSVGFIDQFTINLDNNFFMLSGENWDSSTVGVSWNAHTLTYHGTAYTIAAGSTTNKYIYWSLNQASNYQTSATFPDLSYVNPQDGSVASGLVAVWNSSDGKLYPFWSAKLAPAFISTALIEDLAVTTAKIQDLAVSNAKIANATITDAKIHDLSADKITTGTLAASVSITLTRDNSTPAKLIWQNTGSTYADIANTTVYFAPNADNTDSLSFGTDPASGRWVGVNFFTGTNGFHASAVSGASFMKLRVDPTHVQIITTQIAGVDANNYTFDDTAFLYSGSGTPSIGGSSNKFVNGYFSGTTFTGLVLAGLASTDASFSAGLAGSALLVASATTNASVGSLGFGTNLTLRSAKTGSGTVKNIEFLHDTTTQMLFDNTIDATNTCAQLRHNGSTRRVAIHNDGTRDLLYLV